MKLWLDDLRPVPEGWVGAKSVSNAIAAVAIAFIRKEKFEAVSLDHDLGDFSVNGTVDAIKFVDWMAEYGVWPAKVQIHTANPVGRDNMTRTIVAHRGWVD